MKTKTKTTRKRVYPILQQIVQYLPEWTLEKLANHHDSTRAAALTAGFKAGDILLADRGFVGFDKIGI